MRKLQFRIELFFLLLIIFAACTNGQGIDAVTSQPEVDFLPGGTAFFAIPSLNGKKISIRIQKPEGNSPFPVIVGVAGGDGLYAFHPELSTSLLERGIMVVDFAPQGRGESEGEDNYHGYVHQDDLKAIVDFISELSLVQKDNIGVLSYSYGVVLATGALARYPDMPVVFLIDWEGPASPGKDIQRGLENDEAWAYELIQILNNGREPTPEELSHIMIHGGSIFDENYWEERDASRFAADLPCPYLRVQFEQDHAQGPNKYHMMSIVNTATTESGQWSRVNDNPANITYSEENLSQYHFHTYGEGKYVGLNPIDSKSGNSVLLAYIEEMFFSKPYNK
jgi:hypothetical protein